MLSSTGLPGLDRKFSGTTLSGKRGLSLRPQVAFSAIVPIADNSRPVHLSLYNSQLIQKHHNTFSEHCAIAGGGEVSLAWTKSHCPQGTQPGER